MKRDSIVCLGLIAAGLVQSVVIAQTPESSIFYPFKGGRSGDGNEPTMLIQAKDGNFYGITAFGGGTSGCINDLNAIDGCGTIFRLTPGGTEVVLYSFSGGNDGGIPSSLVQGQDGKIYGTTLLGGPDSTPLDLCSSTDANGNPIAAPCCLAQGGGAITCGTIFEFDPSQVNLSQQPAITLNTLYTFTGATDGASPGNLILGSTTSQSEVIFGTTQACSNCKSPFSGNSIYGTVFSFVPAESTPVTPTTIVTLPFASGFSLAYPNSLIQRDQNTLFGTTQMGGATSSTACPTNATSGFGCGGVFEVEISNPAAPSAGPSITELCDFGDNTCPGVTSAQDIRVLGSLGTSEKVQPQTVVNQSGVRFPVGGNSWSYSPAPIALTMDSSGNIYGTTPPGCAVGSTYTLNSDCNSSYGDEPSLIFELTPPTAGATSPSSITILYTFSGNNPSPPSTPDGAGTIAGLTLATDGNFYGLSGDGSTTSELFELPVKNGSLTNYVSLAPSYSPNWMIQGSSGDFYGTSPSKFTVISCGLPCGNGGGTFYGSVFEVTPASTLKPPVGLSFNFSQITLGSPATLTWAVPYAFSETSQQCYAFVEGTNASTAGSWSGLQKGSLSNNVYGNSKSITPTALGSYTYALTCGGTVSGSATLQVVASQLLFPTASLPTGVLNQSYSGSVAASGGVGPYTYTVASGSLPPGLTLNSNGTFTTGPPTVVGSYTFSITVKDAETPAATVTTSFSIVVMGPTPQVSLMAQPNTGVSYGQSVTLTASETPAEGIAQGYSWTIDEDGGPLVTGALSTGSGSYTMTTTPHAGQHTFSAIFSSTQNYYPTGTSNTVSLTVAKATATVSAWPTASAITYGQTLASSTLSGGTASTTGAFTWTTSTTAPGAGIVSESVTFTPADTTDYNTVTGTVMVTVNKATPTVTAWPTASAITVGQTLASSTLSGGTASVGGTFTWTTPTMTPGVGNYSGSVTFTPTDSTDYNSVTGTVTVTVNVAPSFTLSSSPMSVSVAQGSSGTTTITVTDVGGFSGNVTLAATGSPSGVTSSFAAGSAPGTQVLTLTASTSAQVTSAPVTVTVTGTSGTLSATTSISLSITPQPGFTVGSGGTTSISITPGATTGNTGIISIVGTNGFSGAVNLSCVVTTSLTSVSDMPSCSLNPASVTISGTAAQTSTLTVTTTAASSAENDMKQLIWPTGGTTLAVAALFMVPKRRRNWLAMLGMLPLWAVVGAIGCGGGGGSGGGSGGGGGGGNPGTTAGTYTITVTGTSGTVSAVVGTVNVTVQ